VATNLTALSTEYLRVQVTASSAGATVDPSADTVQFAFPATTVQPSVWYSGSWETISGVHYARCLVGPTGGVVTLTVGNSYDVWVKITDSPEIPVRKVATVAVI